MVADALSVRIAHLAGAYEQITKGRSKGWRPSSTKLDERSDRLEQKLDTTFGWVIGVVPANLRRLHAYRVPARVDRTPDLFRYGRRHNTEPMTCANSFSMSSSSSPESWS